MKNPKIHKEEYKLALSKLIIEDEAISDDLKKTLARYLEQWNDYYAHISNIKEVEKWLGLIFDKERQEGLQKEYLRFARKKIKENETEVERIFSETKKRFENSILDQNLDFLNANNANNTEAYKSYFNFNPISWEFIFVEKQPSASKEINLSEKEFMTFLGALEYTTDYAGKLVHILSLEIEDEYFYYTLLVNILRKYDVRPRNLSGFGNLYEIINTKINSQKLKLNLVKILLNSGLYFCINEDILNKVDLASEYKFELVKFLAESDKMSDMVIRYILKQDLTPDQKYEFAKILAVRYPTFLSRCILDFNLKDPEKRFELAKNACRSNFYPVLANIKEFWIDDTDEQKEIFKIAVTRDYRALTLLNRLDLFISSVDEDSLNIEGMKEFYKYYIYDIFVLEDQKHHMKFDMIFAENTRMENVGFFFGNLLFEKPENISKLNDNPKIASREYFLETTCLNLDKTFLTNDYSSKTLQDFYFSVTQIYNILGSEFLSQLQIDKEFITPSWLKNLTSTLQKLSRVLFITKDEQHIRQKIIAWLSQMSESSFKDKLKIRSSKFKRKVNMAMMSSKQEEKRSEPIKISKDNISELASNLDMIFIWFFKETFKINCREITIGDIEKLEEKWWNLDVLYTLVARYYWNTEWIKEIPLFASVIESVLDDRFHEFKYKWNMRDEDDMETAKLQIEPLNESGLEKWKENPSSLKFISTEKEPSISDDELLKIAQWEFLEQCIRQKHLDKISDSLSLSVAEFDIWKVSEDDLNAIIEKKPAEALKMMSLWTDKKHYYLLVVFSLLKSTTNKSVFEGLISKLKSWIPWIPLNGIDDDIRSIEAKLMPVSKWKDALVFTTLTDDPKLLLEIGDLVEAWSCQNYRTWSMIESLLWYVIDANVKWVLSFTLDQSNLWGSKSDYSQLCEMVKDWNFEYIFDAPKKMLQINDPRSWKSFAVSLNKAVMRRIVKLWATKDIKPWIFLEREYFQNHHALPALRDSVSELLDSFVKWFYWTIEEKWLKIIRTRNPGWVYSDRMEWIMKWDYEI